MSEFRNPILRATNTLQVDKGAVNVDKVYWLSKNTADNKNLLFVMDQDEDNNNFFMEFSNNTNRNNEFTALTASSTDFAAGLTSKPFVTSSAQTVSPRNTATSVTADAINPKNVTRVQKVTVGGVYKILFTFGRTKVAGNQVAWSYANSTNRNNVYAEITSVVANMGTESESVGTGITAGTTQTQGGATALTAEFNNVTTVANANDGVKLPSAAAGLVIVVKNNGANIMKLYPATGDAIDALSANAAMLVPVNATTTLVAIDGTTWESRLETVSTDTIAERTDATGVTIDGTLLKDGGITTSGIVINAGTPQTLTGAGAVNLTTHTTLLVTTGANALTLADGAEGQYKFIRMKTDGGDGTLTVTNLQGGTTITFNDAGDFVYLYYVDAKWHILTNSGTTVA